MITGPDHGLVRGVRAGVLTLPVVGAAGVAHIIGGGCVDVVGLLLVTGLVWPAAVALMGRRRSILTLVGWLTLLQLAAHKALALTCGAHSGGHQSGVGMLSAHGAAILVTGVVLGRADAGLWAAHSLLRTVRRFLAPHVVLTPAVARPVRLVSSYLVLRSLWKAPHALRRGPPAPLSV